MSLVLGPKDLPKTLSACIVADGFGELNPSSGIGTAMKSLAMTLQAEGYSVTVLLTSEAYDADQFEFYQAQYDARNISLVRYVTAYLPVVTVYLSVAHHSNSDPIPNSM